MSDNCNGLFLLDSVIEKLRSELLRYANLPNAKPEFIKKQNQVIEELCNAYNSIDLLKFSEVWLDLENRFQRLEMKDPELSGYYITIRMKPKGNNFSQIIINPFE